VLTPPGNGISGWVNKNGQSLGIPFDISFDYYALENHVNISVTISAILGDLFQRGKQLCSIKKSGCRQTCEPRSNLT